MESSVMTGRQIEKTTHKFQMFSATKKIFKAVAEGKHIVLYGPSASGKSFLVEEHCRLLNEYERVFFNFDSVVDVKHFLKNAGSGPLLLAEATYTGSKQLSLPLDNVVEIFMQQKYVA